MAPKTCETYELELSALLDGELPPAEIAAAVEHVLDCASCAAFFRAARRLDVVAASGSAGSDAELAPGTAADLWERIRGRASAARADVGLFDGRSAHRAQRRAVGGPGAWLRAAALVVVGLGGGFALGSLDGPVDLAAAPGAAATLASERIEAAAMDERRFVALADELMRADVRYQRAMLQVLRLVPAIETGEGLQLEEESPSIVTAASRGERARGGLL